MSKTQRYEYRVSYRRRAWSSNTHTKSRTFESEPAARRFVDRLRSSGRPDLSPAVAVTVERREVGEWTS